jgi:hypothetical protein
MTIFFLGKKLLKKLLPFFQQRKTMNFYCIFCDYKSNRKSNFYKHSLTAKHILATNGNILATKPKSSKNIFVENEINTNSSLATKSSKSSKSSKKVATNFFCTKCNKKYKDRTGLWKHRKKCKDVDQEIVEKQDKIIQLLEKNNQLLALQQNTTFITNTNTNTNNKVFNLQFFLNHTCKEAMNMSEFVNSIQVELSDLENTGQKGYVNGITNIVLKNLNKIENNLRPIHCSDPKRETIYIKENDEWRNDNRPVLVNAIKIIANENIKLIQNWQEKYPDSKFSFSKKNDMYLQIVSNSMDGEDGDISINKIISKVAKEITIDKYLKLMNN